MNEPITHASCFSGIGAVDLAAHELGIINLFNVEVDPFCRKVLDYWFPESTGYGDIKRTDFTQWRGKVTILSGGFPCQGFSLAGQRRGTEDDRYLWPQMLRAIHEIRPSYVLGENVFGILSMVESANEVAVGSQTSLFGEDNEVCEKRARYVTELIREDLEREGYSLQVFCIPACAVGAPHRRDRVWFVAKRTVTHAAGDGGGGIPRSEDAQTPRQDGERHAEPLVNGGVPSPASPHTNGNGNTAQEKSGGFEEEESGIVLQQRERGGETERVDGLSAISRDASYAHGDGLFNRVHRREGRDNRDTIGRFTEENPENGLLRKTGGRSENAPDPNSAGLQEAGSQPETTRGARGCEEESTPADATGARAGTLRVESEEGRSRGGNELSGECGGLYDEGLPSEYWRGFPTVEPAVCGGDDVLPEGMAFDAISYPKWRAEATKALGNSMVVVLVKEILRAIMKDIENDRRTGG